MHKLTGFADYKEKIEGKWWEEKMADVVAWGLVKGYPDGTLRPDRWPGFVENCVMNHRMVMSQPEIRLTANQMEHVVYVEADGAVGSGFWVPGNLVVTNAHVVFARPDSEDPRSRIEVTGNPGAGFTANERLPAQLEAVDQKNDVALLSVNTPIDPPAVTEFVDVQQGEQIWMLGNPFGYPFDVCGGIVRSLERKIHVWADWQKVYAVDAPINPGNSGGLAVNARGQAVGVPNAGVMGAAASSYGYIIPAHKLLGLEGVKKTVK